MRVGVFDESVPGVEDYDLWLRLAFHVPFIFVPGAVAVYRRADEGAMLSSLRSGKYETVLRLAIERALALLPDTEDNSRLKQQVRANCELRLAGLLTGRDGAWERLRAGLEMWPALALDPSNRASIAQVIAGRAADSDSPIVAARGMWGEIHDLQRGLGRRDEAALRRLLAAAYWHVGILHGKGIGRPANPGRAARAIARSLILDPAAIHHWGGLLRFLGRPAFGRHTR